MDYVVFPEEGIAPFWQGQVIVSLNSVRGLWGKTALKVVENVRKK